jgi:hypothetical protein
MKASNMTYRAYGTSDGTDTVVQDYAGFGSLRAARKVAQRSFDQWGIEFVRIESVTLR